MSGITANDSILRICRDAYKPVSTDEIYTWAGKNLTMPHAYSGGPKFDISKARYLIEPFRAIKSTETPIVVVNKANRTGGTLLIDVSIPWFIANRPGPIQFTQATDGMVKDHVNNRLYPLLANCKPLKHVIPTNDKEFTNTGIRFPTCTIYVNGEKESAFQQKGVQISCNDEVHMWSRGSLQQAMTRTLEYDRKGTSKTIVVSIPGTVGDDFDEIYKRGSQEEWCVPCLSCSYYQFPVWRQQRNDGSYFGMIWDENEITKPSGSWNYPEVYKTIRYECEYCGHKHLDSPEVKERWNKEGKYISKNPNCDRKVRSFRVNAVPMNPWDVLVSEFLSAKKAADEGRKENLTEFFRSKITQPLNPTIDQYDGHIKTEVYDVLEPWDKPVILRAMTIDVQKYHFWTNIREFAPTAASRQLYFGKIACEDDIKKLQEKFKIPNNSVFVDVGNTESQEDGARHLVYEFIDRNCWTGLRGDHWHDDGWHKTIRGQRQTFFFSDRVYLPNTKNGTYFLNFAPNTVRDILKGLRDGKSHEFKCLDNPDYKSQMFAERKVPILTKYGPKWVWKNVGNRPNHAFDTEVMLIVAAMLHPSLRDIIVSPTVVPASNN